MWPDVVAHYVTVLYPHDVLQNLAIPRQSKTRLRSTLPKPGPAKPQNPVPRPNTMKLEDPIPRH